MFILGWLQSFLSHGGNGPLPEFKASRLLGSWDDVYRLTGLSLLRF